MLHWHPQPHTVFPEWLRVLRVQGLLLFSCFGPDTLKELRQAYARAGIAARPMPFVDMHDFGDMMVASGFATPVMDAEMIRLTYASPQAILREVAALGGNPRDDRAAGLVAGRRARLYNESHWSNARIDELASQAAQTADTSARAALYAEMSQIFEQEGPVIIPFFRPVVGAYRNSVQGLEMHPFPGSTNFAAVTVGS